MADEAECVRRDKRSGEALRGSLVRDVHRGLADPGQAIERALRDRPVLEIEIRDAAIGTIRAAHARSDRDDAIRVGERQVAQQQPVRQHEHRVVRGDAEGQDQNRRRGEPAFLDQQAHTEPCIAEAVGDDTERAPIPVDLLHLLDAAERTSSRQARRLRRLPATDVVGLEQIEVGANVRVEVLIQSRAPEQRAYP